MNDRYLEIAENIQEPSVTSSDPNERKLARRLRIQRRLEVLTKKTDVEGEEIVEKNPIEKQILASCDILDNLRVEGDEVVSCVRVANDARELQRRKEEQEIRRVLLIKLEEDDRACMKKYEVINEKWSNILVSKDPLDIHAELKAQSDKCMEIMDRKNTIIAQLKQELERADMKFIDDQKNQHEDIHLLIDRMDNQMNIITRAYRRELMLINDVIESERKVLMKNIIDKWEALYKKLQEDSIVGLDKRKDIMREYEEEMKKVMIEHQEEFRSQKISFELEIQELQQEVQNTKTLCFMNIEKLDYSYAVLKQREDENAIVKNQQKRRINKLQDIVNELKKNYAELEKNTSSEIQELTDQVIKTHGNILDLMEKLDCFTNINDRKFMQIWDMNIKNANELLDKILIADKIICEQALGTEWKKPEKILLKKEDLPSYNDIMNKIETEKKLVEEKGAICKSYKPPKTIEDINTERRLLNNILKHIVDHCDYLVEDRLLELLLPYTTNDQLVIKLDSVFQAFDIKCEEELGCLLTFFLPYAYCSTCINVCDKSVKSLTPEPSVQQSNICDVSEKFTEHETRLIDTVKEAISDEKSTISSDDVYSLTETSLPDVECTLVDIGLVADTAKDDNQIQQRLLCDKGHLLEIETTCVTRALKEFIERYHFVKWQEIPQNFQEKLIEKKAIASRNITIQDITDFWKRYGEIFSTKKERLWDSLIVGFKKYHVILKERHRLNVEIESFRRQNAELRRLLKTYIIEPTSHELP